MQVVYKFKQLWSLVMVRKKKDIGTKKWERRNKKNLHKCLHNAIFGKRRKDPYPTEGLSGNEGSSALLHLFIDFY